MLGDGTKQATIQSSRPPARLLDITRLIRRAGRFLTGVDRVEMAYLRGLLTEPEPVFGLVRTTFGYLLLDQDGLYQIEAQLSDVQKFEQIDILSRVPRGLTKVQRQALSQARRLSVDRSLPRNLYKLLTRNLPPQTSYVNVGHSNLTERVLDTMRSALSARISVMVHDVIPLDYPHFQRPGTVDVFEAKLKRVQKYADFIIYNSADTQKRCEAHLIKWGSIPRGIVSHLGTDLAVVDDAFSLPEKPYFVCLSTIEPRKNHAFLLDIWDDLGAGAPELHICGARGWNNEAVFKRLDGVKSDSLIFERSDLDDSSIASLLQGSRGLLFPSHAEGFGLPMVEAAALGVPILCNDLEVIREILGDIPVYATVSDSYLWKDKVKELALTDPQSRRQGCFTPSNWSDHFKVVLNSI